MPYFPPAPGGSVLLPNTVDNLILTDMPAGTVKGRATGVGAGDPQDLSVAQLLTSLGVTAFGQCRVDLVSAAILRLSRCDGYLLTIDNVPQIIPAAGVDLAPTGLPSGNNYYIYAYMNAGVMTLVPSINGTIIDPRNGLRVLNSNPAATLVGMARVDATPAWYFNNSNVLATLSYFNRRNRVSVGPSFGGAPASSATPTLLAGKEAYFITWSDDAITAHMSGFMTHTVSGGLLNIAMAIDGGGMQSSGSSGNASAANGGVPFAASQSVLVSETVLHNISALVWTSPATANYQGQTSATVRG